MTQVSPPITDRELQEQLDELYRSEKLNKEDGKGCEFFKQCEASCLWDDGDRDIMPPVGAYVGEQYRSHRIMFVGINSNMGARSSEEFYAPYGWISKENSQESVYIDGAIHRLCKKLLSDPSLQPEDTRKVFAFSNLVKCSVDELAGAPTPAMIENCAVRARYLFRELVILSPRIVFCLGEVPFQLMFNYFCADAESIDDHYKDWLFKVSGESQEFTCVRLYNPGQGYRGVRRVWKALIEARGVDEGWHRFLLGQERTPEQLKMEVSRVESLYPEEDRIDRASPLYDHIVEHLIQLSNTREAVTGGPSGS